MAEEDEQGLQLVIAIRAAAIDVQEEVELGWAGQRSWPGFIMVLCSCAITVPASTG